MRKPIHKFFYEDLIEEQHKWSKSEIAMFYQTSEDEVISALAKANEAQPDNPLSTCYLDPDSEPVGCLSEGTTTQPPGDVHRHPGEVRTQGREGVVAGNGSS